MRKLLLVLFLGIILVPTMLSAELKISGEMWNRWTMDSSQGYDGNDVTMRNSFSLERGYFGLEKKFTETTKGRFTVDMFSTDALKDGAGLKLKYAYVDFAGLTPVNDLIVTAGLQKVYFGTIYDWNYTLIGKAPSDEYKLANSADYGLSVNGYLPNGMGEYAVGVYNGEGYKNWGSNLKDNTDMSYLANLRLTPITGVTVGGSFMTNSVERDKKLADGTLNSSYNEQTLLDGVLRLAYGPVDFWAEYLSKDVKYLSDFSSKDYTANAIMLMPIIRLAEYLPIDMQVVGRFDQWDETDNTANKNLLTAITAGLNYNFLHDDSAVPAMQLQLNYTTKSYDEAKSAAAFANGKKDSDQLMLQLKWRFANTVK